MCIGETERNLAAVRDVDRMASRVLLLDEVHALMG